MQEVVTIMEADVDEHQWGLLKQSYENETANVPEAIKQTFLMQSRRSPQVWRIITHWRSQSDLDQMRNTEKVPVAVRIFEPVGASPRLEIWNSAVHHIGPELR